MDILSLGLLAGAAYFLLRKGPDIQADPVIQDTVPEIADETGYFPQNGSAGSITMPTFPPSDLYQESGAVQIVETPNRVPVIVPPNTPPSVVADVSAFNAYPGVNYRISEIPEIRAWADLDTEQAALVYGQSEESALSAIAKVFNMAEWVERWNKAVDTYAAKTQERLIRDYGVTAGTKAWNEMGKPFHIISYSLIPPFSVVGRLGRWRMETVRIGSTDPGYAEYYGENFPISVEDWERRAGMRTTYSDKLQAMLEYVNNIRK